MSKHAVASSTFPDAVVPRLTERVDFGYEGSEDAVWGSSSCLSRLAWSRAFSSSVALLIAVFAFLVVTSAALAIPSSVPDDTVQTNGRVSAILVVGERIYLGGNFTLVDGIPRSRLAAIDATTGALTSWAPGANRRVMTLAAAPDGSRIYAGGSFTSVSGVRRNQLVALDAVTGAVDASWNPTANGTGTVYALAVSGNRVYLGGNFTMVNGQTRTSLAMVDGITGTLNPTWVPTASGTVRTLVPSLDATRVYVGGNFGTISGLSRPFLGAVDPLTGGVQAWRPLTRPNGLVYDLQESGGRIYTAENGGGGAASAYDTITGRMVWRLLGDGDVQAVAVLGDKVYIGGHFVVMSRQTRRFFAAADAATGALDSQWAPNGSGGAGVWALEPDAVRGRLYAGGDFVSISGQPQQGFAQFSE